MAGGNWRKLEAKNHHSLRNVQLSAGGNAGGDSERLSLARVQNVPPPPARVVASICGTRPDRPGGRDLAYRFIQLLTDQLVISKAIRPCCQIGTGLFGDMGRMIVQDDANGCSPIGLFNKRFAADRPTRAGRFEVSERDRY